MSDLWTTLIDWKLPPHRLLGIWKTVLLDEGSKMNPSLGNKGFVCLWVRVYHNAIYEEQDDQERIKVFCNIILWTWNIISLDLKYYIVGLEILHRRTCRTSLTTDNELWLWYVDHTKRLKIQAEILYRWTCRTSLTMDKPPTCSSGRMGWLCPTLPGIHCLFVFVFVCLLLQWDSKHYIVSAFLPCQVLQLPTSNLTNSCLLGMTCSQKLDWRGSCPERTL